MSGPDPFDLAVARSRAIFNPKPSRKAKRAREKLLSAEAWATGARVSAAPMTVRFLLPWPPSVNHYWRTFTLNGRAMVSLSGDGKAYRKAVEGAVLEQRVPRFTLTGRLRFTMRAAPPNNAMRDLDNLPKGVLDALNTSGVIRDDSDFDEMHFYRVAVHPGGMLHVELAEIGAPAATLSLFSHG